MKLLLALYLLSFFLYSVSMLQCLINTLTQQCGPDELCGSLAYSIYSPERIFENETGVMRQCVGRKLCDQFDAVGKDVFTTINLGLAHVSFFWSCCESDTCNNITITLPEPDTKPNGLKCLTCMSSEGLCNSTVPCVGNQDQCLTLKAPFFLLGIERPMGCITKPLCGESESMLGQFKCCSRNLCNKM